MKIICCLLVILSLLFVVAPAQAESASGFVMGWGQNISGEVTGTPAYAFTNGILVMTNRLDAIGTVMVGGKQLNDVTAIAAGFGYSLALKQDGTVTGWGGNLKGAAIGIETPYPHRANGLVSIRGQVLSNVTAIATDHTFSLALKKDGTLVTWGENYIPTGLSNIVAIATGAGGSWAVQSNGAVVTWSGQPSRHDYGQLRSVDAISNTVAIAVDQANNSERLYALSREGTVTVWGGHSTYDFYTPPAGLSNVTAIAAGRAYALALKKDGTVMGWGFNPDGRVTGIPTETAPHITNDIVRIDGQVLSNVVSIAVNERNNQGYNLALKKDGTVVGWGKGFLLPPAGLSNVVAISAGLSYCLAITTNSAVAEQFRQMK